MEKRNWVVGDQAIYSYLGLPKYNGRKCSISYIKDDNVRLKFDDSGLQSDGYFDIRNLKPVPDTINKEEKPLNNNQHFWMLYSPNGKVADTKWVTQNEAETEAGRLAKEQKIEVFVMRAIRSVIVLEPPVQWTTLSGDESSKVGPQKYKYINAYNTNYNAKECYVVEEQDNYTRVSFLVDNTTHWVSKENLVQV